MLPVRSLQILDQPRQHLAYPNVGGADVSVVGRLDVPTQVCEAQVNSHLIAPPASDVQVMREMTVRLLSVLFGDLSGHGPRGREQSSMERGVPSGDQRPTTVD
jgi:hypothetical protein